MFCFCWIGHSLSRGRARAGRRWAGSRAAAAQPSTTPTGSALDTVLTAAASGYLAQGGQNTGQKAKLRHYSSCITFSEPGRGKLAQNCSVLRLWALFGPQALGWKACCCMGRHGQGAQYQALLASGAPDRRRLPARPCCCCLFPVTGRMDEWQSLQMWADVLRPIFCDLLQVQ